MKPIYSRRGRVVAWLGDQAVIFDELGVPSAFMNDDAVTSYNGRYLGRLQYGFFRDQAGNAVAFVEGATGGPVVPLEQFAPVPPMTGLTPVPPIPEIPPVPRVPTMSWGIDWAEFLDDGVES